MFSKIKCLFAVGVTALLVACGGGGSDGTAMSSPQTQAQEAAPVDNGQGLLQKSAALAAKSVVERTSDGRFIIDGVYFPGPSDRVPPKIRVSMFGDSLLLGVGTTASPLDRIKQVRPEWEVRPHVAGGVSTTNAMTGYDENTEFLSAKYMPFGPQKPFMQIMNDEQYDIDVVVLELGFNDAFRNDPKFKENYAAMIQRIYAAGKIPVVTGIVKSIVDVPLWREYNRFVFDYTCGQNIVHANWDVNTYNNPQWIGDDHIHLAQNTSDMFTSGLIDAIELTYWRQQLQRSWSAPMYEFWGCNQDNIAWMNQPPRNPMR